MEVSRLADPDRILVVNLPDYPYHGIEIETEIERGIGIGREIERGTEKEIEIASETVIVIASVIVIATVTAIVTVIVIAIENYSLDIDHQLDRLQDSKGRGIATESGRDRASLGKDIIVTITIRRHMTISSEIESVTYLLETDQYRDTQ